MPSRGDRSAPTFDPKQPRELRRYFGDLEFLFNKCGITDQAIMKKNACRYVDIDTSELWETLPEYTDATKTYENLRKAIHALYPGSDTDRKWSVADMDKLVGERSRLGILTIGDLGEYYRQFLAITTFLKSKSRLSDGEQSRAFARGFQADLWAKVEQRLQLKDPDHDRDDAYPLDDIHKAARYVLHGTSTDPYNSSTSAIYSEPFAPATATIKTEEMTAVLERLTDSFIKALAQQQNRPPTDDRIQRQAKNIATLICNFCGVAGHLMRECPLCQEYIVAGKCKRNIDNKIVLPSGAFIPREIPGKFMKERIDEYHRRNPNQMGTAQLMYGILSNEISPESQRPAPIIHRKVAPEPITNRLSEEDRIQALERELFYLRGRGANKQKNNQDKGEKSVDEQPVPVPKKTRAVPEVVIPVAPKSKKDTSQLAPTVDDLEELPEHPFAKVPDATYAPPKDRNFAAPPKPAPAKKQTPAYRTVAPIYDNNIAQTVFDKVMSQLVTLSQRELCSLSPELSSLLRQAVSPRRGPTKDQPKNIGTSQDINVLATDEDIAYAIDDLEPDYEPTNTFNHNVANHLPPDAIVLPDIYDVYLNNLPKGYRPDQLIVAKESSALRSIHPIVDNQSRIESILDPGSQIIAMSEEICIELGLPYDSTVVLTMQSANGELDRSLGLARNVPLRIGDITLYVQIHVIRSPAYDILLGRPFDILTQSVIRNYSNEDQMITIHDPNTRREVTVPTMPRGRSPRNNNSENFTVSRN